MDTKFLVLISNNCNRTNQPKTNQPHKYRTVWTHLNIKLKLLSTYLYILTAYSKFQFSYTKVGVNFQQAQFSTYQGHQSTKKYFSSCWKMTRIQISRRLYWIFNVEKVNIQICKVTTDSIFNPGQSFMLKGI